MNKLNKQNRDRLREQADSSGGGWGRGIEGVEGSGKERKRTQGHGQQCDDCRVLEGWLKVEVGIRGYKW